MTELSKYKLDDLPHVPAILAPLPSPAPTHRPRFMTPERINHDLTNQPLNYSSGGSGCPQVPNFIGSWCAAAAFSGTCLQCYSESEVSKMGIKESLYYLEADKIIRTTYDDPGRSQECRNTSEICQFGGIPKMIQRYQEAA
ncbi:hypothetical protein CIHG_04837 [Coccidioides immitis H538.4]|uniref:Uncharacterized protein n=1 Tax=Coccidioides immitis H538.4 TaxID=396776 RepID=A0A0J8RSH5_COCIT|nr:hypothetical protein CIHG_04837 [Coccidioides immitis H538.4]